ncbi:hypothetical protein [Methylomusa anaerophila]|uniref:FlgN protein n=1 Tax=Methylomusa anaerophila TaxID=1930071 RepID=A0A348AKW2_9FIRM|nr:hypothetical protein [Methylomusa anaerophila]BBB91710.1 hypothetical protein MAMMFC1_02394 [Methylomusa anaerophila]
MLRTKPTQGNAMADVLTRGIRQLWLDYQFLTIEINKFAEQQHLELVSELMSQREKLQTIIAERNDTEFIYSEEGIEILKNIQELNQLAGQKLQFMSNRAKQQRSVSQAYEGTGEAFSVGRRMNRET